MPTTPELEEWLDALDVRIENADPKTEAEKVEWILDRFERLLFCEIPLDLDAMAEKVAEYALDDLDPEARTTPDWSYWIEASEKDLLAWKVCQVLVAEVRYRDPGSLFLSPLGDWAWDMATGIRKKPPGKRGRRRVNEFRNMAIALAVEEVHKVAQRLRWMTSNEDTSGTVFHLVADRFGYSYTTVRQIWTDYRPNRPSGSDPVP